MNEYNNQLNDTSKIVNTSNGCLIHDSGKAFADSSRYQDIMEGHQDLQFNLNQI